MINTKKYKWGWHMLLERERTREVSFPVGGIGAGCIGISGAGRLRDWEIFNHAGKNLANGCSHFAVRAERDGKVESARILNGDLEQDFSGSFEAPEAMFRGFGWGPGNATMCGFPHFADCSLAGEFPVAEFRFRDNHFPAEVNLTAWSPFVPGDSALSSLPCALFDIEFFNRGAFTYDFSAIGVLSNFWNGDGAANAVSRHGGFTQLVVGNHLSGDALEYGEIALSTDAGEVSHQEYWYRGGWMDPFEVYWHDLNQPGHFRNRTYGGHDARVGNDAGLLAAHLRLAPGEKGRVRFVISWYVPNCSNDWYPAEDLAREMARCGVRENRWRNYYAGLCSSAADAALRVLERGDAIWQDVRNFRDALHASTIPAPALAGAAENLAVLISPTCLRLEDGTFWAWEGVGPRHGSCSGSCQHVWNYAQALPLLFPDLERSMRESHLKYGFDPRGGLHFRLMLPLGIQADNDWWRPCVDGAFGEVMKVYREWKVCGCDAWLKSMWSAVKRILEFAWSPENPDRWDPERSGILAGRQHHTLDMELFGPSGWLQGHYLGALKAAAAMAPVCGDAAFGEQCQAIFERGCAAGEALLFNGEYYVQKLDLDDRAALAPFFPEMAGAEANPYWSEEHREIKYQIGDGCAIDSHLGQWYASLYGIGGVLDPEHVKSTLAAIYRHNFLPSLREFANPWRVFALNDEGGTLMCTWPAGTRKPVIPLPYNTETMTGFEWAFACHLVMAGELEKGGQVARAIRERYRGDNRNPWNEIECGSNYARSMAAYAMLQAYSGFSYDMGEGRIGFQPVVDGDFQCFWSLGRVWGTWAREGAESRLHILYGEADFTGFDIAGTSVARNGAALKSRREQNRIVLDDPVHVTRNDVLHFR